MAEWNACSYPKSGRTWLRIWLQDYADGVGVELPEIVWSHEPWKARRRIWLYRNPLDTLVSRWCHKHYREGLEMGLPEFLRHPLFGIAHWNAWVRGMWEDDLYSGRGFLYEDLRLKPLETFSLLVEVMGLPPDDEVFNHCMTSTTIPMLRTRDWRDRPDAWRYLPMLDGITVHRKSPSYDEDGEKFRKGNIGGWQEYMSRELALEVQERAVIWNKEWDLASAR